MNLSVFFHRPVTSSSRVLHVTRSALLGLTAVLGVPVALEAAAIWDSANWALHAGVGAGVTYDSNIFGRRGGDGDTIFSASPSLRFERVASATLLEFTGDLAFRKYADYGEEDAVDPTFGIRYAYPHSEEALPTREGTLRWSRSSDADPDVGERIRLTELAGRYEGTIFDSGKTLVDVVVGGGKSDYSLYDAETISGNIGFAVGMAPRGLLKYALGYDFSSSTYESSGTVGSKVTRRAHDLSARLRGEITPKISGRVSLGVTRGDFSGALDFSKTDWTVGAALDWAETERRRWSLGASRRSYFTADGQAAVSSTINLGISQEMPRGFTLNVRTNAGTVDRQSGFGSSYDLIGGGVALQYGLTGLFGGEVGWSVNRYSSAANYLNYTRHSLFVRAAYRF